MAENRRVKQTKQLLRESLIKFLLEKPISRVTVKEICEYADVNRATYYAHYADPFDQISRIKDDFIAGINGYLDEFMAAHGNDNAQDTLTRIFEYLEQNAALCTIFLGDTGGTGFQEDFMELVRVRVLQEWSRAPEQIPAEPDYILTFVGSGILGMARRWLHEGETRKPPARMAALMLELARQNFISVDTAGDSGRAGQKWTS